MKKIIITIVISLLSLTFISSVKALEINYTGSNKLTKDSDILFDLEEVYPGDTLESTITIKNSSSEDKEIYLKLENENNKLTDLILEILNDEKELYNGDLTFNSEDDYILIDTFKASTQSNMTLKLKIPATMDNNSSLEELQLKLIFYIIEDEEYVPIGEITTNPETADNILNYVILLIVCLIAIVIGIVLLKKKKQIKI